MPIVPIPARRQKVITRLRWFAHWIEKDDITVTAADLADLIMDGSIDRDTLTATVQVPDGEQQDKDVPLAIRMEIPIVQNRPIQDALDLDPTGLPLIGRFAGASEAGQQLMQAYAEACDIILHPARFVPSTSPVEGDDIDNSRATGDVVPILSMADLPQWETPPALPGSTMQMVAQ